MSLHSTLKGNTADNAHKLTVYQKKRTIPSNVVISALTLLAILVVWWGACTPAGAEATGKHQHAGLYGCHAGAAFSR